MKKMLIFSGMGQSRNSVTQKCWLGPCQGVVRFLKHLCFTFLSEIDQKFFVFFGIIEKGTVMHCKETIVVMQFLR